MRIRSVTDFAPLGLSVNKTIELVKGEGQSPSPFLSFFIYFSEVKGDINVSPFFLWECSWPAAASCRRQRTS